MTYKGTSTTTYYVRRKVANRRFKRDFKTSALADSFRAQLVTAARSGEACTPATGLPVSMSREEHTATWYEFACAYVDMKWPDMSGKSRMGIAETLVTVTPALVAEAGRPRADLMRRTLYTWVDRRVVVNPEQASSLLAAVGEQGEAGKRLVAFFGLLCYAGLRPGEAAHLPASALRLPAKGWGELFLPGSAPTTGAAWSDSGRRRDERGLKHRAREAVRVVPAPPPLTALLLAHLENFGTNAHGRLFGSMRTPDGDLSDSVYGRVWASAREAALTAEEAASPLARRPYDLRHAAVSTWLNAGMPPTQVAEWAGHSVAVLLRVYAKCLAGQEEAARRRVGRALGLP